jgi:hypothetical protein
VVTTFAGSPQRVGGQDGPLAQASFVRPVGLAFDAKGVLYVADPASGMRTISPDGRVGRISELSGGTPYGVAAVDTPHGAELFVADLLGLVRRNPDGTIQRFATPEAYGQGNRQMQGLEPLGYPFAATAFDDNSVVYTDVRGDAVRYLDWYAAAPQVLGGIDVVDGSASTAGHRDGRGDASRFDAPMGIAIDPSGRIVVADSGSRRIRIISNLDRAHDVRVVDDLAPRPREDPQNYSVAFVGTSNLWNYMRWSDSIPGIVESGLADDLRVASRALRVTPFAFPGAGLTAETSFVSIVLAQSHAADLVVVDINPVTVSFLCGHVMAAGVQSAGASKWTKALAVELRRLDAELREHGTKLVVVTTPVPADLSPAEGAWNALVSGVSAGQVTPPSEVGDLMNAAVRAAGVPYLDGWAILQAESRTPNHSALFGTQDAHFSVHGRAVIAQALIDFLRTLKPWQ